MGRPSPRHGAAVRGRTQKFLPGLRLKNFVDWYIFPGLLKRDVVTPAPGKSTAGKQAAGVAAEGLTLRHQAQWPYTPSGVQGAPVPARQGRRDRNGRCKPGFSDIGP